ncbi:MAG TPA: choice-of-anchor Q domain-containing protein [Azospirillaceae bacterium]|nr:choice-of-anchor Q domain-containing protein [Azospirillaceae bacterium]
MSRNLSWAPRRSTKARPPTVLGALLLVLFFHMIHIGAARAFDVAVSGSDGKAVGRYHWLLEEDATFHPQPGVEIADTLSVNFHRSHMPVVATGTSDDLAALQAVIDPTRHYFLSVLPEADHAIGGAAIAPGQTAATVVLNPSENVPAAQISLFVFQDDAPINNAPDLPQEQGLAGFTVILEDAGGRFGVSGGRVTRDVFGNPLGTTYDPDGAVLETGSGVLTTDADGRLLVRNLAPAKYGIKVIPPIGDNWVQTSTIEGTKVIDAWVKANEPPYFTEFGPPGPHISVGFIKPTIDAGALTGGVTIKGRVVNLHNARPPEYAFYNGQPLDFTGCWIGLNDMAVGTGRGIYAQPCEDGARFAVSNVPPGAYQLVVWDDNLDLIFASLGVTVNPDGSCVTPSGSCDLVEVPVFSWFARLQTTVFQDKDGDGFRDCMSSECNHHMHDELGLPNIAVNLRFRDGSLYQTQTTDQSGEIDFSEVFPFFSWLVAEVDNTRLKPTGATIIVDAGGPVPADQGWAMPSRGILNPQPQFADDQPAVNLNTGNNLSRTETGPVLTETFQAFLGQTNVIEWGKKAYAAGENGGISGVVYYATTRAENDPRDAVADPWEPGIPGVTVKLYKDFDGDGKATDQDLLQTVTTDGWDATPPTDCQGAVFTYQGQPTDCYDGLRNFNQVRPGVFDGGYAFSNLEPGTYIVEAIPPAGYEIVAEEDKNVDFGDSYQPTPGALPPVCVGETRPVPAVLSSLRNREGIPSPFAGQNRPLCDRRQVRLDDGQNAAADFFLFTQVPVAGHINGFILDDTANEFDPTSPQFGEKYAPPFLPVSIRDWHGREISRVYADRFGAYNALVPSTYTANVPMASGMSPNMLIACMNDPGPVPNPADPGQFITDPHFNRQYSQFCYTFQYMPGTTTYLDTPVVPVAAFAGANQYPLDCEVPDGTPKIRSVAVLGGGAVNGPWVSQPATQRLQITAMGAQEVLNPDYPAEGQTAHITRDYGFGGAGTVTLNGTPLINVTWTDGVIEASVPTTLAAGPYQLEIKRADTGRTTVNAVTVWVGNPGGSVWTVQPSTTPGATPIQNAIDAAKAGDLILVGPGNYEELVILWKPVTLQGAGAGATVINAVKAPGEKLQSWRNKIRTLVERNDIDLLPGQPIDFDPLEPGTLNTEEGAGILVVAKRNAYNARRFGRIDGFTVTGADHGGGIVVNGYAPYVEISNNQVRSNAGFYGGGIRVGHPFLTQEVQNLITPVDADSDNVRIHHNHIAFNGGQDGAGGGVSICTGADGYQVTLNYICGNFSMGDGGGIAHYGLSRDGLIADNRILFNQTFNQGRNVSGGGLFIGGVAPLNGPASLSNGSGSVKVVGNLIQGNQAGAGDGGGIRLERINGEELNTRQTRDNPATWYRVAVLNNMIVNNVAGLAGGGMSLQDAARVSIIHNTIAHNDSTATAGDAMLPAPPGADIRQSTAQPAGIVSRAHSTALTQAIGTSAAVLPLKRFSNPVLESSVIWHNRSFTFYSDLGADPPVFRLQPDVTQANPNYWDLAVLGTATAQNLGPRYSVLTDTTGYTQTGANNIALDPGFIQGYVNGGRTAYLEVEATVPIGVQPAFDEGGNFIDVRFGPLKPFGNYHLMATSPAMDKGNPTILSSFPELAQDIDRDPRPQATAPDIGADEYRPATLITAGP